MTTLTFDIPSGGLDGDITRVALDPLDAGGVLESATYTPSEPITGADQLAVVLFTNGYPSAGLMFGSADADGKSAAMNNRYLASGDVLSCASWAVGSAPSDPGGSLVIEVTP